MRNFLMFVVVLTGTWSLLKGQNVGIGTLSPDPSARLDVVDTQRGVLIPRMTTAQRNAISSPAASLLIYNTDCNVYQYYVPGTGWVTITHSGISGGIVSNGASVTALPPTGVGYSGYTASWSPVLGASGYTIKTYDNCSGASPTLVNTTTINNGTTSSAFVSVSITCNSDLCYEVIADVPTSTGCGSNTTQIVSNRMPISMDPICTGHNKWKLASSGIPVPGRDNYVSIAHKGYVYIGFGHNNSSCFNDWWKWDPCTNTWTSLPSPPGTVGGLPFIFAISDSIYVGGGRFQCGGPAAAVYRFDTQNNSWSAVDPIPATLGGGRNGAVGASDGRYGYVACGWLISGFTNAILRFDPYATPGNQWGLHTSYPPGARWLPFMTYHAGKLWIGTGQDNSSNCTNEFYSYDLSTGIWTPLAPYPRTEYDNWAVAYNGRIYVTGGHSPCPSTCTNSFYYYDIATNTWNSMPAFPGGGRNNLQLNEVNGVIYGGLGHDCGVPLNFPQDWWQYCP